MTTSTSPPVNPERSWLDADVFFEESKALNSELVSAFVTDDKHDPYRAEVHSPALPGDRFLVQPPNPPLRNCGMEGTEIPDESSLHDLEPEEGNPALDNWTRAVNGQAQERRPTPNWTVAYLVAEQAGFRNAWALGIAPPPSIDVPPQFVQQTSALPQKQDISSAAPQPFATPVMQRLASHALHTGSAATPGSATQGIKAAPVKFTLQQIGIKRRLVLVEDETDKKTEPFEIPVRNTNGEPREGGASVAPDPDRSSMSTVSKSSFYQEVPPDTVNIHLLGNLEITAEELLTFFPLHTIWHNGINRLVQNGWSFDTISKFINWARNLQPLPGRGRTSNALEMQVNRSDDRIHNGRRFGRGVARPEGRIDDLTTARWEIPRRRIYTLQDYLLRDIIKGVAHFPTEEGRRELTMVMEYAREHPDELSSTTLGKHLMVSDIPVLIQKHGFSSQVAPIRLGIEPHDHPDFRAVERHRDEIGEHERLAKRNLRDIAPNTTPSKKPSKRKGKRTLGEC
ncbi:uncharacterized protein BDZ99DRAFT_513131 [Mytilinidion resinicola]|uniref:Uncharacterized protein n=1 Tax=Mytilinidion resinicola TaxID=574789 RepID=A0A6A6Z820_9PEZI|nr:uncharacterized protein BDZ99DRAFT_513131 [Mytilinidion resinicola]KAF2816859.1 hypothetical protein BDZ99DRAFT_513131 [Mytilinidion resinicola]